MRYGQVGILAIALVATACASKQVTQGGSTPTTEVPPSPPPPPPPPPPVYAEENDSDYGPDRGLPYPSTGMETPPPPMVGSSGPGRGSGRPIGRAVSNAKPGKDYLPFIDVAIDESALYSEYGLMLQDRYTRIQIVTLKPDAYDVEGVSTGTRKEPVEMRNYNKESRNWFSRMMGSRNVTRTLIAEFDVAKPDIKATKALFSATFSSDSQEGEAWTTNESISVYATPYFKVGPNTTIEGRFRLQLSDERQGSAGASVMGALTTAANLIAPASTLVTYFNQPLMLEASNFLNTQSTTLFGQSITEQSTSAFSVKSWSDTPILVVSAELPDAGNIKQTKGKGSIGQWAVYLDQPIPSIFTAASSDYDGQEPDYSGIPSGDILAFDVGEDLTVYDYIFSRLDLSDRIASLNDTADADTARLICSRIERGMSEIGFTSFDAAAAVWAASASDQFNSGAQTALQQEGLCQAMDLWHQMGG
ncbi:MAG: hypothetical protein KJ871_01155 [Alphaproteobacteria bacterium]|nr:hypothetical protein [Alphaproteobacteria bacterium]MBU2085693.1 hypothetical protein [Alphaproteobacteria bacterium]MBU2141622.1 hypothetical protein [Alphaproteobacteria bacterium]MBU2197586.1 hypothetical protein [Alphaproteobacteria bacterium]